MIRILLADDHELMRQGVRNLLEANQSWQICGEASNGREAVEMAVRLKPDITIIDLTMPELNGLEATRQIRKNLPGTEVLIFTMHDSEQLVREVLSAGARGYVLKSDAARYLITAIESLSQHKPFFTSKVSETILDGYLKATQTNRAENVSWSPLTEREREIVQMLAESKSNKEIAGTLGISPKTVETHRRTIMRKLEINSIVDLVRYAIRNNIVEP